MDWTKDRQDLIIISEQQLREMLTVTVPNKFKIKRVIYNGPATIIFWDDGTKTVVKCHDEDNYDRRIGFLYACAKRLYDLSGYNKPSAENRKPFDSWIAAWTGRKAEVYEEEKKPETTPAQDVYGMVSRGIEFWKD